MSAQDNVSAFKRKLTGLRQKFLTHPQRVETCLVAYAFCVGIFLVIATIGLNVSPSLAVAYFIGLTAIGSSGYAIHRMSQIGALTPLAVPAVASPAPPPIIADNFIIEGLEDHLDDVVGDGAYVDIPDECPSPELDGKLSDEPLFSVEDYQPSAAGLDLIFRRSPVVTLPHRRVAIIRGDMAMSDGNQYPASDELRFAHAVAFATQNRAAQGRSIMIPLAIRNLTGEFMDEALDLVDSMPGLAERIIFELPPETLQITDPGLVAVLSNLRGEGFKFAARVEHQPMLTDFITRASLWSEFSYILMPERQILAAGENIIRLFEPLGAKLIALDIKSDTDVVEVLEFDVPLAAGPLFETASAPEAAKPAPVAEAARPSKLKADAEQTNPAARPSVRPRKRTADRKLPAKTGRLHSLRKQLDIEPGAEPPAGTPRRKRAATKDKVKSR